MENVLWGLFWFILGLPAAYLLNRHFHVLGRKGGHLMALIDSSTLIHNFVATLPRMQVLYDGQPIRNFTATTISIWNDGETVIRDSDLDPLPQYHLRVEVDDDAEILDIQTRNITSPESHLALTKSPDGKRADITFRYLEPKQGGAFRIYHTSGGRKAVRVTGKLVDLPLTAVDTRDDVYWRIGKPEPRSSILVQLVAMSVILGTAYFLAFATDLPRQVRALTFVVGLLLAFFSIPTISRRMNPLPPRPPEALSGRKET